MIYILKLKIKQIHANLLHMYGFHVACHQRGESCCVFQLKLTKGLELNLVYESDRKIC